MKKYLKNILYLALVFGALWTMQACNDFDEMNENPTKWTKVDPNYQLTYVELLTWGGMAPLETYLCYHSPFVQHLEGGWLSYNHGGQYRKANQWSKLTWDWGYCYSLKNLVDMLDNTKDKPEYHNLHQITRILKVWQYMILTDTYGDIPYFEGAQGYTQDISKAKYDSQEDIYYDFLKELTEAESNLNEDGGSVTGDIVYSGNVDKWKRFANSLRLRVAMRMAYANPQKAKNEIMELLLSEAGFMLKGEDALIPYMDIKAEMYSRTEFRRNALAQFWRESENTSHPMVGICAPFFNHMKETHDPRIFRIARCYSWQNTIAAGDPFARPDLTDEILALAPDSSMFNPVLPGRNFYQPWPGGYESTVSGRYESIGLRPMISNDFLKYDSPGILMTRAEVQLLLAEAEVRWPDVFSGEISASEYYENGVTEAMNLLLKWGVESYESNEISDYFAANPFPSIQESQIRVINEQLWILHFNNPPEAYANWRRTRYPVLKPSNDPEYGAVTHDSQTIPTRLCYPYDEIAYNNENMKDALERMGGTDNWNYRVWFDCSGRE